MPAARAIPVESGRRASRISTSVTVGIVPSMHSDARVAMVLQNPAVSAPFLGAGTGDVDSGLAPRRSRVLIADDKESIRSLFHRVLSADGHAVVLAPDGASALAAVHRQRPDVILLDVAMPLVDGLEGCRQLKGDP